MTQQQSIELTVFGSGHGVLTKSIKLDKDGKLDIQPHTAMASGTGRRVQISSVDDLAELIEQLKDNEAITLGVLKEELPDQVKVVTKEKLNGGANIIARTKEYVIYREGKPALVLFDYDAKWKPDRIVVDDYWEALLKVLPSLRKTAHVIRHSTSSSIRRTDTGEELPGSSGVHVYVAVQDGADAERFLKTMHERCWLAGYGWIMIGEAGTMLERSIIDRFVHASERLIFEAPPILKKPLVQDAESRRPIATKGEVIDTADICPDLTAAEQEQLDKLLADARKKMEPEAAKVRAAYVEERAKALAKSKGISKEAAVEVIENACHQVLLPDFVLDFTDKSLKGCTVGDVLDDPARFEGKPLADPIEGFDYGPQTAKVLFRYGTIPPEPFIHSFAHGGVDYSLLREAPPHKEEKPKADSKRRLITQIDISNWDNEPVPEQEWAVQDRIPVGCTTLFSGEGGGGKSLLHQQMGIACVLGVNWLGANLRQGPALIIDAEDPEAVIHKRLADILQYHGKKFADVKKDLHPVTWCGEDAVLAGINRSTNRMEPTALYKSLLEMVGDIKPSMIGIASSADVFAGNEIDRSQVQQFIALMTRLTKLSGGGLSLISHPSVRGVDSDTGISGSTQWHNSVRARFYIKSVKADGDMTNTDLREIIFKKNNYGPINDSVTLQYQNGLFLPVDSGAVSKASLDAIKDVFLTILRRFNDTNRNVSAATGPGYAPKAFALEPEAKEAGHGSTILGIAMRELLKDNLVHVAEYGKASRPHYRLVVGKGGDVAGWARKMGKIKFHRSPFQVVGKAPNGIKCSICGKANPSTILHSKNKTDLWHPACAEKYFAKKVQKKDAKRPPKQGKK
jgi:RecA-family ATPase